MKAVLRCDVEATGAPWDSGLLRAPIAGLSLLERHLLAYREVGVTDVEVWGAGSLPDVTVPGLRVRLQPTGSEPDGMWIEQRADTLFDPRLLARALVEAARSGHAVGCVDDYRENYPSEDKSPYRVGAADDRDARVVPYESGFVPVGLEVKVAGATPEALSLHVGRHYWHRVTGPDDVREGTRKVFFATMKPTDGVFARTNRRVSIPISTRLAATGVTPNMVSIFVLLSSAVAGILFAQGSYGYALAGSVVSWIACMLDGVDGELARAKFQATEFGAWLEMVGDYLYYIFVYVGMGWGLYRRIADPFWLMLGLGSVAGVFPSFILVARLKRRFRDHTGAAGFYLTFQREIEARASNPLLRFFRRMMFMGTRAAVPYYFVLFALFDGVALLLVFVFVATTLGWLFAAYTAHLAPSPAPAAPDKAPLWQ